MAIACDVFTRIAVVAVPRGGSLIQWSLRPGFRETGPYRFYVDVGEPGTDEWEALPESPVLDDCKICDPVQRYYDQLSNVYYRVKLVLPNVLTDAGLPTTYYSQPQQANGFLSRADWLISRDIMRREYLRQRVKTNATSGGYILKRRRWGTPCPSCLEYDTQESQQGQSCLTCYGTAICGGYFPAVDYRFTFEPVPERRLKRNAELGANNDVTRMGRGVSYPHLDAGDVYVRADTGERFIVQNQATVAEVGGIPLVVTAELRLAPTTDIVYSVPMDASKLITYVLPNGTAVAQPKSGTPGDPATVPVNKSGVLDDDQW